MRFLQESIRQSHRVFPVMIMFGLFMFLPEGWADAGNGIVVPAFPEIEFKPDNIIALPPGDIAGSALLSDRGTPGDGMDVLLFDSETGEEVASAIVRDDGEFVLENIGEGRFVVQIGQPGIVTLLDVEEDNEPGFLNFSNPRALSLPVPGWAPAWVHQSPALGYTVAGGAIVGGFAYWRYHRRERRRELSPIMP